MIWHVNTRSITFSGRALPEIVGIASARNEVREPMLAVRSVRGREAVGELFEYVVVAESQVALLLNATDATQIDLTQIVGTDGTVAIEISGIGTFIAGQPGDIGRSNIGADVRYINGEIVSARIQCVEDRAAVYEFVLRPFVWRATQNSDSRIFSGTVVDILQKVFGRYLGSVDWRIGGPWNGMRRYPMRDMVRQAWESDWTFALRLMEEWGLVFWFEHAKDRHTLVVSDTSGGFHRHGIAYEELRFHTGGRIDEEHISSLAVTHTVTAGKACVNDHDYMQPRLRRSNAPNRQTYEAAGGTADPNIEIYAPAEFAQPDTFPSSYPHDAREEGQYLARVKVEAARCKGLRAKGTGRLRGLQPGRTFRLVNYPQDSANREYLVLACELDISEVGTSTSAWRTYAVKAEFELHPVGEYYRLPQLTPKPRVEGYEYAVIVAPQGREMWIDSRNRLLIQFDWDREGRFDGATSIWVRVVTQWQGSELGVVTPGRAGQMVVVSHVHGDPDRPVVAGFVADRFNTPPWELPANAALSDIRSKSLDHGAQSNHLALDDTAGKLQAQLASDHAKSSLSLGHITRIDGNKGRQDARGEGFELRSDRWGVLRASMGLLFTSWGRSGATGKVKDMDETHARLTEARSIHEELALSAQQHGAQQATGAQRDVAKALSDANAALRGRASDGAHDFPEFGQPDIAVSSAANLHAAAQDNTHIVSGKHTALTAGGNVAIAALKSLFASVREAIAFYASKSITMIAATGRIHLEARTDALQAVAREDVTVTSQNGWLRLAALKGIEINAGGTLLRLTPQGVTVHTNGHYLVHAASHATDDPQAAPVMLPVTQENPGRLAAHHVLVEDGGGFILGGQPYRITLDDGQVIEGVTNGRGEMQVATSNAVSFGLVELMSQSEPDKVISASTTTVWRDDSLPTPETVEMPEKRTTKVGGKSAETPGEGLTGDGKPPVFVGCDPMNWGLRTYHLLRNARAADTPPTFQYRGDIEYPVTMTYTAAVKESLCKIDWASLAGKTDEELRAVIVPAVQGPIWNALQAGPFGLPERVAKQGGAMPNIVIVSASNAAEYSFPIGAHGVFQGSKWVLCLSRWDIDEIIRSVKGVPETNVTLIDFADTVYHEARHCQQLFWQIALLSAFPDDYREFSDMRECFKQIAGKKIFDLACATPFPNDSLARAGIHAMLVFYYYWVITKTKGIADGQFIQADLEKVEAEVCKVRNVTPEQARTMAVTYTSYLHEQDAFLCGEVVKYCWIGRSQLRNPGTCTSAYAHVIQSIGAH
ncbi:MAG: VgrG protein [uncultured Paraburkholderia sp.]|nr:type VI secretion system Vgr family protein [uncultured Paraburkholderia sp.]CAH2903226.1 MAG: VgrG protein [uncultured Paraburkholderia sp.]CAH2939388.1 MAG: VgrG protein [uncultured Paraburkholderia sp.]